MIETPLSQLTAAPALEAHNPATGEAIGRVLMASKADVDRARAELRQAAPLWAARSVVERVRVLRQFQKMLIDSLEEITVVINKDAAKSRQDALVELFIVVDLLQAMLRHAPAWLARQRVSSGIYLTKFSFVEPRPYGTVAVISPWNYPFLLALQPTLTALLAGNAVMLKPSEVTPMVGLLIEKLFKRVPELAPFVRVLHGDGRIGAAVVDSKPDLIYLTGSTKTGRIIAKAAAEHLIPTIFELGGKDPMIVLADADIDSAARWAVWGACTNAGQVCTSVERVYVVEPVYDRFVERAVEEARKLRIGYSDEVKDMHHYGPLASERQAQIVDDHVADALARGARALTGAERNGLLMPPTVLVDVDHSMKVVNEETFGPVLPIMKVRDDEEAIAMANRSDFGLSAYAWGSIGHALKVLQKVEAGALVVNDTVAHFALPYLPFGGIKQSGNGRAHGKQDLLQFTRTHSYAVSLPPISFDIATLMRVPGNYRIGEAVLRGFFGVGLQQRLSAFDVVLGSYKVQQVLKGVSGLVEQAGDAVGSLATSVTGGKRG